MASSLPLTTRFHLGHEITAEQAAFFNAHGFLVFDPVASAHEVAMIKSELDRIQASWLEERRQWVNGIPVFWGKGATSKTPLYHHLGRLLRRLRGPL